MRRVVRHGAAVLFLSMWVAVHADGAGGRSTSWSSQSAPGATYFYYAPAYSIPYPVVPTPCQPIAPTPPMPYAGTVVPVPKTPETKEPPVKDPVRSKAPSVTESRSMGGGYAASGEKDRCKVGFWNVSGRDVTLKVGGQSKQLAKDRVTTMEVSRSFVWQIDQREPTTEKVPADQAFHEVIIR